MPTNPAQQGYQSDSSDDIKLHKNDIKRDTDKSKKLLIAIEAKIENGKFSLNSDMNRISEGKNEGRHISPFKLYLHALQSNINGSKIEDVPNKINNFLQRYDFEPIEMDLIVTDKTTRREFNHFYNQINDFLTLMEKEGTENLPKSLQKSATKLIKDSKSISQNAELHPKAVRNSMKREKASLDINSIKSLIAKAFKLMEEEPGNAFGENAKPTSSEGGRTNFQSILQGNPIKGRTMGQTIYTFFDFDYKSVKKGYKNFKDRSKVAEKKELLFKKIDKHFSLICDAFPLAKQDILDQNSEIESDILQDFMNCIMSKDNVYTQSNGKNKKGGGWVNFYTDEELVRNDNPLETVIRDFSNYRIKFINEAEKKLEDFEEELESKQNDRKKLNKELKILNAQKELIIDIKKFFDPSDDVSQDSSHQDIETMDTMELLTEVDDLYERAIEDCNYAEENNSSYDFDSKQEFLLELNNEANLKSIKKDIGIKESEKSDIEDEIEELEDKIAQLKDSIETRTKPSSRPAKATYKLPKSIINELEL